jgi:dTDP-4-dehydrorhamnose reductase
MSKLSGTFNVGCFNGVSKAEFALSLANKLGLPTRTAKVGTTSDASFKARRPLDMTLNIKLLENTLGIKCPDIYEEITKTANEYLNA